MNVTHFIYDTESLVSLEANLTKVHLKTVCQDLKNSYIVRTNTEEKVDYIKVDFKSQSFSLDTSDSDLRGSVIEYKWLIDLAYGQVNVFELATFRVEFVASEDSLRFEPTVSTIIQIYK